MMMNKLVYLYWMNRKISTRVSQLLSYNIIVLICTTITVALLFLFIMLTKDEGVFNSNNKEIIAFLTLFNLFIILFEFMLVGIRLMKDSYLSIKMIKIFPISNMLMYNLLLLDILIDLRLVLYFVVYFLLSIFILISSSICTGFYSFLVLLLTLVTIENILSNFYLIMIRYRNIARLVLTIVSYVFFVLFFSISMFKLSVDFFYSLFLFSWSGEAIYYFIQGNYLISIQYLIYLFIVNTITYYLGFQLSIYFSKE